MISTDEKPRSSLQMLRKGKIHVSFTDILTHQKQRERIGPAFLNDISRAKRGKC
jgi:hypothetical protein